MIGSSVLSIGVLSWASFVPQASPLSVFGVLALSTAFFVAAAVRLVWAAISKAGWESTTLIVLWTFCLLLVSRSVFEIGFPLREVSRSGVGFFPQHALLPAVLAIVSTIFAPSRPVEFVRFSEGLIGPFLRGTRDVFRHRLARNSLLGLWVWAFVAMTILVVLIRLQRAREPDVIAHTMSFGLGALVGIVLAAINRHSYRFGWTIAYAATGLVLQFFLLGINDSIQWPMICMGICLGIVFPPLVHYLFTWTSPKYHGVGIALMIAGWCAAGLAVAGLAMSLDGSNVLEQDRVVNVLLIVCGLSTLAAWLGFFRPCMEGTFEFLLWPIYRFRSRGPGCQNLPTRGPSLVIANHSAWLDPLFMAKVLPLPIIPMMTSKFYDLPVISFLMRRVIGTIRVPEASYRHEAPELKEAVAALDRGECVVIFPEGFLRRKEEQPLRRFGRGIWAILSERPQTPVFACWIEGNWGSYFSYRGGPPTKGKRIDFWKHIDIGIVGPVSVDPAILPDHLAVRSYLMHQVADARASLGLGTLELPTAPAEGEKE